MEEKSTPFFKALMIAVCATVLFIIASEIFWRSREFPVGYNDSKALWSRQREKADLNDPSITVLIGSSRIQFDVDLATYYDETGSKPAQLAMGGSCPLPALQDIADKSDFSGTLLIGVTESLFFSKGERAKQDMRERVKYYHRWSLAQRASLGISETLESGFIFLDEERFSLNPLLKRLPIENRTGVWVFPNFPMHFVVDDRNRQPRMTEKFLRDTTIQREMRDVWTMLGLTTKGRGMGGDTLTNVLVSVKASIDKIRSRGGQVCFVRCPSDGKIWEAEQFTYPRDRFWDAMLDYTETPGVHFADYPELSKYSCPEWSHIRPEDAIPFTRDLVAILKRDKGIKFPAPTQPKP